MNNTSSTVELVRLRRRLAKDYFVQKVVESAITLYIERSEFDAGDLCELTATELTAEAFPKVGKVHPWFGNDVLMRKACEMLSQEAGNDVIYEDAVVKMNYPPLSSFTHANVRVGQNEPGHSGREDPRGLVALSAGGSGDAGPAPWNGQDER